MKKSRILAVIVALMMMATVSFAAEETDPVVVKAGEGIIGLKEAQSFFDYYYSYFEQMFAENNEPFTDEQKGYLLDYVMEDLTTSAIIKDKIIEYGFDKMTDEEAATLLEESDVGYAEYVEGYAASVGLSVEEAQEDLNEMGATADVWYESAESDRSMSLLRDEIFKDVEVTDEEIEKEYNSYVEEDKATYENDIATYEMYTTYYGASDIFYQPEGFRYVKHILLAMPDDVAAELTDIETDMQTAQNMIDSLNDELYAMENVPDETEAEEGAEATEAPRTAEQVQADIEEQTKKYDELNDTYEAKRAEILPSLSGIIDEIMAKLDGGETFDALIEEYNTDPGMANNPDGYKVHKDSAMWEINFRDAAMGLEKIGDVSDPVLSDFGVHIIEYAGDVPGGAVEMTDEVRENLREGMLSYKQEEAFNALFEEWKSGYEEIELHRELIQVPVSEEEPTDTPDESATPDASDAPDATDKPADPTDEPSDAPEATDAPEAEGTKSVG